MLWDGEFYETVSCVNINKTTVSIHLIVYYRFNVTNQK